ncbi:MAG: hypothetical protein J2P41_18555 [Blastocatellia bacterium]|nr:hypothetical protein [Blastocatellia bacterium]
MRGQQPSRKAKSGKSQRITFAEAQRLLAGESEGNISNQPTKFSSTRLKDGRVLELYYPLLIKRVGKTKPTSVTGYGVLYESEAALDDEKRVRHMLEDLIPDGQVLIENVPQLVARLEKRLGVRAGTLDYSRASLKRIDVYINGFQRSHTTAQTNPELFQELTAYYGETLRRELSGEWRVREEKVDKTHIQKVPNISFNAHGQARDIKPWDSVNTALYDEESRGIGLTKLFDSNLAAAR